MNFSSWAVFDAPFLAKLIVKSNVELLIWWKSKKKIYELKGS